jgi:uroporphyrin-III C-methyltransferase/precorrin-2 dehydrogenase/sirohydrochlorin ferrochelatase
VSAPAEPALFPVFLKLEGRKVLLVGAGKVAEGKLLGLLAAGALVTVVAPTVTDAFGAGRVVRLRRPFHERDVDGAWLVVAAAPPEVNRQVVAAAEARGVFVNAVDDPAHATAYTGGVVRRGGVTLAVSTEGRAPALAGLLREALEAVLPEEIGRWVAAGEAVRAEQKRAGIPMGERRPLLLRALNRLYAHRGSERAKGDAGAPEAMPGPLTRGSAVTAPAREAAGETAA